MERDWGNERKGGGSGERMTLYISSFSLHFLPLSPFPTSKFVTFCRKMLNTALLSRMSQKSEHTRYEKIILGRICCEEASQIVPACTHTTFTSQNWQPILESPPVNTRRWYPRRSKGRSHTFSPQTNDRELQKKVAVKSRFKLSFWYIRICDSSDSSCM